VSEKALQHREVKATIWLTKGDHFWFQCEETVDPDLESPLRHDIFCAIKSLKGFVPQTDNVRLIIRSLRCDIAETLSDIEFGRVVDQLGGDTEFGRRCIDATNEDELPVIYVNSNNYYFNITKSAEFKDLIFDGINQFAYIHEEDGETIKTPYWPMKLCSYTNLTDASATTSNEKTQLLRLI